MGGPLGTPQNLLTEISTQSNCSNLIIHRINWFGIDYSWWISGKFTISTALISQYLIVLRHNAK